MNWLNEARDFLNSATMGQVVGWEEVDSEEFDPLRKVFILGLTEPFSRRDSRDVRLILRALAAEAGFMVSKVEFSGRSIRLTGHQKTPSREFSPMSKKRLLKV